MYDTGEALAACRLAWLFSYYGLPNVRVLNGGFTAFLATGGAHFGFDGSLIARQHGVDVGYKVRCTGSRSDDRPLNAACGIDRDRTDGFGELAHFAAELEEAEAGGW